MEGKIDKAKILKKNKSLFEGLEGFAHDLVDRLAYSEDDKERYDIILNFLLENEIEITNNE